MTTRKELVEALRQRYRRAVFGERIKILDEFVAVTGYHRKHAIRLLCEEVATAKAAHTRNRLCDEAVRQALTVLWEAADRVCGKRLKALIPMLVDSMERHGHLDSGSGHQDQGLADQRGDHRPGTGCCAFAHRRAAQAPQRCGLGHSPQHPGANLRRLARSATGLLRDRHGRALRRREDRR